MCAKKGTKGIFFCYRMPTWNVEKQDFTLEGGPCQWYLYDTIKNTLIEEIPDIIGSVRALVDEPRVCVTTEETLLAARAYVQKHIKNNYLKKIEAPLGVKPKLLAWLEIN